MKIQSLIIILLFVNSFSLKDDNKDKNTDNNFMANDNSVNTLDDSDPDKETYDYNNDGPTNNNGEFNMEDYLNNSDLQNLTGDLTTNGIDYIESSDEEVAIAGEIADKISAIKKEHALKDWDSKKLDDRIEKAKDEVIKDYPDQDGDYIREIIDSVLDEQSDTDLTDDDMKNYILDMLTYNDAVKGFNDMGDDTGNVDNTDAKN
jgi:hypothetical protein